MRRCQARPGFCSIAPPGGPPSCGRRLRPSRCAAGGPPRRSCPSCSTRCCTGSKTAIPNTTTRSLRASMRRCPRSSRPGPRYPASPSNLEREVARYFGVRGVEIHLGFGRSAKAAVTPPHLDVARDGRLAPVGPAPHGCCPCDDRLPARPRLDVERPELEVPPPVPRGRDPVPRESPRRRAEHEVGRAADAQQPPE